MMNKTVFIVSLAGLAVLAVPFYLPPGLMFMAGMILTNTLFAMAWNLVFRGIGIISFGHAMFYAVGAYIIAVIGLNFNGIPFLLSIVLAMIGSSVLAVIIGFVALRRVSGIYFAILTLAASELVYVFITKTNWLGRNDGLYGVVAQPIDLWILQIPLGNRTVYYIFLALICYLAYWMLWVIHNSIGGRVMQAIRQDQIRSEFLGINVFRWKLMIFMCSGAFSGLAGALAAPWLQLATPDLSHWTTSTLPIFFTLLGGATTFFGPGIGALVWSGLEYALRGYPSVTHMVLGLLLLVLVIVIPGGITGIRHHFRSKLRSLLSTHGSR